MLDWPRPSKITFSKTGAVTIEVTSHRADGDPVGRGSPIQISLYQSHTAFWLILHTSRTEWYVLRSQDSFCSLKPTQHVIRADRHLWAAVWWVHGSPLSYCHPSGPSLSYLFGFRVVISNFHIPKTSQKNGLIHPLHMTLTKYITHIKAKEHTFFFCIYWYITINKRERVSEPMDLAD